jgi:hypothetical protein
MTSMAVLAAAPPNIRAGRFRPSQTANLCSESLQLNVASPLTGVFRQRLIHQKDFVDAAPQS